MKALQNISINPENAILVIVDMENEFCKPGGKLFPPPRAQTSPPVISNIQKLAQRIRSAGIPVIYIQSVRTLREAEFTVFGVEPHLELGTRAVEIIDELKPQEGDIVVQKFCHDAFYKTNMDEVLQRLVPDPTRYYAVVTGGGISTCVRHAVMGFHLRDYWTVVPVDCVVYTLESDRENAFQHYSQQGYPNVFLSRSDLIEISGVPVAAHSVPTPGT